MPGERNLALTPKLTESTVGYPKYGDVQTWVHGPEPTKSHITTPATYSLWES